MKSTIIYSGAIILLFLFLAACDGQSTRTDTGNLSDLREDMNEVIVTIDEALAANDISEFKNKTDDVVSNLNNKIDDYLTEMDKANRRIDGNARNQVIEMKQKKVEVEFKLALLEQDDYDWNNNNQQNRTGTTTDMRTSNDNPTGIDRTVTTGQATSNNLNQTGTDTRTGTDRTTTDDLNRRTTTTDDMNRRNGNNRVQREIMYGPELVDDLKSDLRDLRGQVEQFAQTLPYDR